MKTLSGLLVFLFAISTQAKDFRTNSLIIKDAPQWVQRRAINRITAKIESKLEWKIRRVPIVFHATGESYTKEHSLGSLAAAVTVKSSKKTEVHMGPLVSKDDYEKTLAHELVHVVFYQKYKGSIPDWLEEGFANFLAKKNKVSKAWLSGQKIPTDVKSIGHPFGSGGDIHLKYKISQAVVEFLDDKCDLSRLLRLSVRKKIETYIRNTCGIKDLNQDFQAWLKKKAFKVVHTEKHKDYNLQVEEVVNGLHIPWGFEFLSDHQILINEKNGHLSIFNLKTKKLIKIKGGPEIKEKGQGGGMDVKKHPQYPKVPWIYTTYATESGGVVTTELARYQISGSKVIKLERLFTAQGGTNKGQHFGSRIAFDENNFVYVSIGDRGHRPNGQDLSTHTASIVRLHEDGRIPKDNPFVNRENAKNEIWSYGHRNPQGMVYDFNKKRLWAIEHGPRGGDEINLIKRGANYGWPDVSYGREYVSRMKVGVEKKKGTEPPIYYYVPSIAPCGVDIYYGDVFPRWNGFLMSGALKLTHLNLVDVTNPQKPKEFRILEKMVVRVRHVKVGPQGLIYFSTDSGKIFRISPV